MSVVFGNKNRIFWLLDYAKKAKEHKSFVSITILDNEKTVNSNLESLYEQVEVCAKLIFDIFSNSNSYDEFVEEINKTGLYNRKYENTYKKAFSSILDNKKEIYNL